MPKPDQVTDPRAHLHKERVCMICGRSFRGNAYFTHKKACVRKMRERDRGTP